MQLDPDDWMGRWLPLMRAAVADKPLLELGCDTGGDTAWLLEQGFRVVATDLSAHALSECKRIAGDALLVQHDLRARFPFRSRSFGVVVASLCLHYFDSATTAAAVAQVHRCLAPGGLFLCRVNSANDVLHGAGQGEEIEPGYHRQSARYADCKRFFATADLDRFFVARDWSIVSREERTVLRYAAPKVAWEMVLRPAA